MFVSQGHKRVTATPFPHRPHQGPKKLAATAPKPSDKRFDYTRILKFDDRTEEAELRKNRASRVTGIPDKSTAAINADLAREASEAERLSREYWKNFKRKVKPQETEKPQPRKPVVEDDEPPIFFRRLPAYGHDIVDSMGLSGVFFDCKYVSAKGSAHGVGERQVYYATKAESVEYLWDDSPAILSNIGADRNEMASAFTLNEDVNRGTRANAKVHNTIIFQLPHDVSPELRYEIAKEWCEENLAIHDLPYVCALHPPSPRGDQRNFHAHVVFSFRPIVRRGRYVWDVNRLLRTDLDNPDSFRIMRSSFAQIMTTHIQREGIRRSYTGLSNAARGIVHYPLKKLGRYKVHLYRDENEYVADVERMARRIEMNEQRAEIYENLNDKLIAETNQRFADIGSGKLYERNRPRPIVPIPATELRLPSRPPIADQALPTRQIDPVRKIILQIQEARAQHEHARLCPRPTDKPAVNPPIAPPKLPVAVAPTMLTPDRLHKRLVPAYAADPTLPAALRLLRPITLVERPAPVPPLRRLFPSLLVPSPPPTSIAARPMIPFAVLQPVVMRPKPLLPVAVVSSALKIPPELKRPLFPALVQKVAVTSAPQKPKLPALVPMPRSGSERTPRIVPFPARPKTILPDLPKAKVPALANRPSSARGRMPIIIPSQVAGYDQLSKSPQSARKSMTISHVAAVAPVAATTSRPQIPMIVEFKDLSPCARPRLEPRPFATVYHEARMRVGKDVLAVEADRVLKGAVTINAAPQITVPDHTASNANPQTSPRNPIVSQSGTAQVSCAPQTTQETTTPTRSSQPSSATPSKANTSAPKPILTFEAFQRAIVAEDCFIIFDQFNNFTPSRAAMKKMNVDPHLIHIPGMQYWLEKQKMAQDEWLHSLVLAQKKPVRTRFDFDLDKIPPVSQRRLKLWATDPECSHQYTYRMLRVMAVFGTDSSRAARNSDVELQLYSSGDLYNTILHAEPHRYPDVNLAEILHLAAKEVRLFVGSLSDGYQLKRDANTMLWPCLDVCKRDPALMRLIHQTIHLTKRNGKPKYPIEVESAMTVYDAERADPQLAKQTLYCPLWTRVEYETPKVRSTGMNDFHQQQRQLDQDTGPTRGD